MTSAVQSYCGGLPPVFWTARSRGDSNARDFPKMQRESGHKRLAVGLPGSHRLMPAPLTASTCGAEDEFPLANSTMRVRLDTMLQSDGEQRGAARNTAKLKDHGLSISALSFGLTTGSRIEQGLSV